MMKPRTLAMSMAMLMAAATLTVGCSDNKERIDKSVTRAEDGARRAEAAADRAEAMLDKAVRK